MTHETVVVLATRAAITLVNDRLATMPIREGWPNVTVRELEPLIAHFEALINVVLKEATQGDF